MKFSELEISEQKYIQEEWERLCKRESINTPYEIFIQKPSGIFFRAVRVSRALGRYVGSLPGYWSIRLGSCKRWGFKKDPFGGYYPDQYDKFYGNYQLETGEVVKIPSKLHTKKEVIELLKELKEFNF